MSLDPSHPPPRPSRLLFLHSCIYPPPTNTPFSSQGTSSLVCGTLYSVTDTTDRIASAVSSDSLPSGAVDVLVRGERGRGQTLRGFEG